MVESIPIFYATKNPKKAECFLIEKAMDGKSKSYLLCYFVIANILTEWWMELLESFVSVKIYKCAVCVLQGCWLFI